MTVEKNNFTDFDGEKEIQTPPSRNSIKLFKKGDTFIGFLNSILDNPLEVGIDNGLGGKSYGNKVFTFVAIIGKDHKSDDGTATGEAQENEIVPGEEYNFFTNYNKKDFLNVNGSKLSQLPLGAIVQLKNLGKKKSEKSSFSYKDVSIIAKRNNKGGFIIHPDYKAIDNFKGEEEISIENIPFSV